MNTVEIIILCVVCLVVLSFFCDSTAQNSRPADDTGMPATFFLGCLFILGGFIGLETSQGDLKDVFLYVCGLGLLFVCGISLMDRMSGKKPMFSCTGWSAWFHDCDDNVIGDVQGLAIAVVVLLAAPAMLSRHGYFERFLLPAHASPVAQHRSVTPVVAHAGKKSAPHNAHRKPSGKITHSKHHTGQKNEHVRSRHDKPIAKSN